MKTYLVLAIITLLGILSTGVVFAEPYKNKNFPPEEIVAKNHDRMFKKIRLVNIVGKYQSGDKYNVYFFKRDEEGKIYFHKEPLILIKLDTDIWLMDFFGFVRILEK